MRSLVPLSLTCAANDIRCSNILGRDGIYASWDLVEFSSPFADDFAWVISKILTIWDLITFWNAQCKHKAGLLWKLWKNEVKHFKMVLPLGLFLVNVTSGPVHGTKNTFRQERSNSAVQFASQVMWRSRTLHPSAPFSVCEEGNPACHFDFAYGVYKAKDGVDSRASSDLYGFSFVKITLSILQIGSQMKSLVRTLVFLRILLVLLICIDHLRSNGNDWLLVRVGGTEQDHSLLKEKPAVLLGLPQDFSGVKFCADYTKFFGCD